MRKLLWQALFAVLFLLAGAAPAAENVRLLVPEKIYAVPGVALVVTFGP